MDKKLLFEQFDEAFDIIIDELHMAGHNIIDEPSATLEVSKKVTALISSHSKINKELWKLRELMKRSLIGGK